MLSEMLDVGSACRAEPDLARDDAPKSESNAAQGSARQAEPTAEVTPGRRDLPKTRQRKAWAPGDDDHAIYRYVKVDCKSQSFVADLFGISQPTISRIVERYEKWQAHADARASGLLDHAERVRAQRALTYLRNEKVITTCLRLAGEVEGIQEVNDSIHQAPDGGLAGMREIRCVNRMLDRTGMASRFLRLAQRTGKEQLELVELEPAIMPAPLTAEEEAEQETQAAADRAELQAARNRVEEKEREREASQGHRIQFAEQQAAIAREEAEQLRREMAAMEAALATAQRELAEAQRATEDEGESGRRGEEETERVIGTRGHEAVVELNLHNLNNGNGSKNGASDNSDGLCDANGAAKKNGAKLNNGRASPDGEEAPRRLPREWMKFVPAE